MSDFFGGLTGGNIRLTDARINGDGPLPTSFSGPEGINGDPDGKYNFNDSLLSGITPYVYGQGHMGSDRNYQQIPNRKQFPVPPLWLPEPDPQTDTLFEVSHSVDMGGSVHWGCFYATALDIEVDPQRSLFGCRESDFALQRLVECSALENETSPSGCVAITFQRH
jgi:hypothetical protein